MNWNYLEVWIPRRIQEIQQQTEKQDLNEGNIVSAIAKVGELIDIYKMITGHEVVYE